MIQEEIETMLAKRLHDEVIFCQLKCEEYEKH